MRCYCKHLALVEFTMPTPICSFNGLIVNTLICCQTGEVGVHFQVVPSWKCTTMLLVRWCISNFQHSFIDVVLSYFGSLPHDPILSSYAVVSKMCDLIMNINSTCNNVYFLNSISNYLVFDLLNMHLWCWCTFNSTRSDNFSHQI